MIDPRIAQTQSQSTSHSHRNNQIETSRFATTQQQQRRLLEDDDDNEEDGDSSVLRDGPVPAAVATTYLQSRRQLQQQRLQQQQPQTLNTQHRERPSRQNASNSAATTSRESALPPSASSSSRPHQHQTPSTSSSSSTSSQPAPIHRVYVLNCATCQEFLSDRGMRAVLLLKPNIVLFSTDAAPLNSSPAWPEVSEDPSAERTCDCLTSSLACHGCGSTIGYHIVQPCSRCTASVAKHQRSANHHRYVFHHNEVTARERRYYANEPGVLNLMHNPRTRMNSPCPSSNGSITSSHPAEVNKDGPSELPSLRVPSPVSRRSSPAPHDRRSPSPQPMPTVDRHGRNMGLSPGDVVYWHNLVAGGERAKPTDPDSRTPAMREIAGC